MEINYIILAHKNPSQIKRLIYNLEGRESNFYIHIDANSSSKPFKEQLRNHNNIYFLPDTARKKIIWGDISIVQSTLEAMRQIIQDRRSGYCVLLSGQDFPLHHRNYIHSFFEKNYGKHFISVFPIPHPNWEKGGLPRIKKYKIDKSSQRKHFLLLSSIYDRDFYTSENIGKLNFLRKSGKIRDSIQILKKRNFPSYIKAYGGGQWWAFPMKTVQNILEFNNAHPEYLHYHQYTLIPDEIFFHSILMYLEDYKTKNIAKSITYVNWERPTGSLPVTFNKDDIIEVREASKYHLFARKFDIEQNSVILDKIEEELLD